MKTPCRRRAAVLVALAVTSALTACGPRGNDDTGCGVAQNAADGGRAICGGRFNALVSAGAAARPAEQSLRRDLIRQPGEWTLWSDLAAALLHGSPGGDSWRDAQALDAALRAERLSPGHPEARFNIAAAEAKLGLDADARQSWESYLATERDPAWRREGERRRAELADATATDITEFEARLSDLSDSRNAWASIVDAFPQVTRELLFERLMPAWAQAELRGDRLAANLAERVSSIAVRLRAKTGDEFSVECAGRSVDPRQPQGVRARLAQAFIDQGDGLRRYGAGEFELSARLFTLAVSEFASDSRACGLLSLVHIGFVAERNGEFAVAAKIARQAIGEAGVRRYLSVAARAQWLQGLLHQDQSVIEQAIQAYESAIATYTAIHDVDNAVSVTRIASDALRNAGNLAEGWALVGRHLRDVRKFSGAQRRYLFLFNAALFASDSGLREAAVAFESAALREARARGVASSIAEALNQRARFALAVGAVDAAVRDLDEAERLLPDVARVSASAAASQRRWLRYVRSQLLADRPEVARALLTDDMAAGFGTVRPELVPSVFLLRGRSWLRSGYPDAAANDFERGIAEFDRQWRLLESQNRRASFLDGSWTLFEEIIGLAASADPRGLRAFAWAESSRSRGLTDQGPPITFEALRLSLPADSVYFYFTSLRDVLLRWRVDRNGVRFSRVDRDATALGADVDAFVSEAATARAPDELRATAQSLFATLFGSDAGLGSAETVFLSPDGPLYRLPFAALVDPATGRFLIEDHAVVISPNAGTLARSVGPGRIDTSRLAAIGRVAGGDASAEIEGISKAVRPAVVLTGAGATPTKFSNEIRSATVVHVAAHAEANAAFPWSSRILLAPDAQHPLGWLTAEELERQPMPRLGLAVLAACETAAGAVYKGEGLIGLVRPFLRHRIPVVGTLWRVADDSTATLMTDFYRALASTGSANEAIRAAQRRAITSVDPTDRLPRTWAAFVVFAGSGSR